MDDTLSAVEPEDLALLLASEEMAPEKEPEPLDRIRMQKAVYILQESGPNEWNRLFEYIAWDWGPFSKELAATLDRLVNQGLLRVETVPHHHPRFRTTDLGEQRVRELLAGLDPAKAAYVAKVRRYVTSRTFNQLLREVYAAYPKMAEKSRFQY